MLLFLPALNPRISVPLLSGSQVSSTSAFLPDYWFLPWSKRLSAASYALKHDVRVIIDVHRQLSAEERHFFL